jgi:cytochrome bd ubiquinol oxidase subunit II
MNALYTINYFIFSIFFTLFMLELGLALISLFNYDLYKKQIRRVIDPVWGVTGTFAVFYLVNFEVSYPKLVGIVGTAYVIPLLVATIFIILRNIFIAFSEYIRESRSERRFRIFYSISTIISAVLLVATLSSGISGIGINLNVNSISYTFLLNKFNIVITASILLISFSIASAVGKIGRQSTYATTTIIGVMIGFIAIYAYIPGFTSVVVGNIPMLIASATVLVLLAILQMRKSKYSGALSMIFVILLINLLGILRYPYILSLNNSNQYIASSAIAGPTIIITLAGGILVILSLIAFVYINYYKKDSNEAVK